MRESKLQDAESESLLGVTVDYALTIRLVPP